MNIKDQIKTTIKALTIFDAHNTTISVRECEEFLGVHKNTVLKRIEKGTIISKFQDGKHHIPKLQFLDTLIDRYLEEEGESNMSDQEVFNIRIEKFFKEKLTA